MGTGSSVRRKKVTVPFFYSLLRKGDSPLFFEKTKHKKPEQNAGGIKRKVPHAEKPIRQRDLDELDKQAVSQGEETGPRIRLAAQLRPVIPITQKPGQYPEAEKMKGLVR